MKKNILFCLAILPVFIQAQVKDSIAPKPAEKTALKYNLNTDGTHYFQVTFLNQAWFRYNESNPGTTQFSKNAAETFDIGLRRTRVQLFGQISDRAFIYFQYGQNNYNSAYNYTSNRKIAAFFHDAICEYRLSKGNQLKIGGGLTVLNGLSRFSQPSVSTIMTLDVPVFLQYTVDQIDQFDRRLAIYARGQVKKIDYRVYMSNPFPISSNGTVPAGISKNASFVNTSALANGTGPGIHNQFGGYVTYNFFEMEPNITPYMTGTYLGTKKVWNIGLGAVYQKSATWHLAADNAGALKDTAYNDMLHLGIETYLDMPMNKEKGTAVNAFAGYYNTNYGSNYLRYNNAMNPATGSTATNAVAGNAYGNAFPMFGTGGVVYAQFGYLLGKKVLGDNHGQLMPYASMQMASYEALQNKSMTVYDLGINWLMTGHRSKLSLDYQSRPTYYKDVNDVKAGPRRGSVILQYQIAI